MKNQFDKNHAFPGICSLCFIEIAEFDGSDQNGKPRIKRFLDNYHPIVAILHDGSKMTVSLCEDCAMSLDKKDYKKIMKAESDGWNWELDHCLKGWSDDQKKDYKKKYNKLNMSDHEKAKARKS